MLIFYFLQYFSLSSGYYAIDFGSYYCKIGNISVMGYPQIVTNRQTKRITPTFLAFRSSRKFDSSSKEPLSKDEIMSLEHEIGINAIEILQKRDWAGSGFFPAFIDANPSYAEQLSQKLFIGNPYNHTRFGFFNLTSSFIHFYIENVYGHIPNNKWHLKVVVPSFYTVPQRHFIMAACNTAGVKNISIISDVDAIVCYYAQMKSHLFQKETKVYLFVDVGATSVKSYLMAFSMKDKDNIDVNRISYVHKDNIGGAFATAKLAKYLKKNLNEQQINLLNDINLFELAEKAKCQLTLTNDASINVEYEEGKTQTINITRKFFEELITDFIIDTINVALQAAGQYKIDRIEIIGGSSRIPKIQQSLMKAFNVKKLGKSLNADEVLTLGALYREINHKEGKNIIIQDKTIKPTVAAKYDGNVKVVCNSSRCINSLFLEKHPTSFSLVYSNKSFNKNLKTRKWSYKWKCSNDTNPNVIFFNPVNSDISSIGEFISNNTKSNNKNDKKTVSPSDNITLVFNFSVDYINPGSWMTNFVDILSNEYVSHKASAELINTLEEIYYSMIKNDQIRSTYLNSFCEEDLVKLTQLLNEIKSTIIDRTTNLPEGRLGQLLEEIKDFKFQANKAKKMRKGLNNLKEIIDKLAKYSQKPFNVRHPDLPDFLTTFVTEFHQMQIDFNEEITKSKDIRNFDIQKFQNRMESAQSKLDEVLMIEKQFIESNPFIKKIFSIRSTLIRFVNRNLWYFNLFNRE